MTDTDGVRVAIAHDYLTQRGGAEKVVLAMARAFPEAPIYTTLFEPSTMSGLYVPVGIVGWDFGFSLNDASGALH